MILYIENPKDSTKNKINNKKTLLNTFSESAGYKIKYKNQ